jgi:hypothetical protein
MPRTISTSATVDVRAAPDDCWSVLSDTRRYAEWVEGTLEVTGGDEVALPGAVYTERNRVAGPITAKATWRVVEVDRARGYQRHETADVPTCRYAAVESEVIPTPAGSRVTIRLEAEVTAGLLTPLVAPLLLRTIAASNRSTVHNLTSLLEASAAAAPGDYAGA